MTSLLSQFTRFVFVASAAALVVHETDAALMDGIHGYWPLNEGSGTELRDFSNTQVPGVLRQTGGGDPRGLGPNNSVWVTDPIRGTVLGFTGNDADGYGLLGAELLPATDLSDGFTWSFWAKSDQANNNDIILGNRYNTNNVDFSLAVEGVPRQWAKFTGNQFEWRPNDVAANLNYADFGVQTEWMHHLVVRDANAMRYYRNGVLTLTNSPSQPLEFPMPIYIGGQGLENWRGYIDEVMLFKRALTPEEIALVYQLSSGASLSDLLTPGPAKFASTTPLSGSSGAAFDTTITAAVTEGTTTVNQSTIQVLVNGQVVPHTVLPGVQLSSEVRTILIRAAAPTFPNLYTPGQAVNATLRFTDSAGAVKEQNITFTVQDYVVVPPTWAVADVNESQRGFLVRTHILNNRRHVFGDRGARIPPSEKQLAGRIAPNVANPAPFTSNGFFVENTYINYNQASVGRADTFSSEGMFGALETYVKAENAIPGMEGANLDPNGENSLAAVLPGSDHTAMEILTYLDLPAGIVTLGVNSDDGFRLTISPLGAPADKFGVLISEFDGGRGSSPSVGTEARVVVQQAGKYAIRLMWYEGQGGSNVEFYSVNATGTPILINDPDEPTAIKAYTSRTGTPPLHVSVLDPFPFGSTLDFAYPDDSIYVELTDVPTALDPNVITLRVNGQTMNPTKTKVGNKVIVELAPPGGIWPPGDLNVELALGTEGTAGIPRTFSWTVPMIPYVTLENCLRTAVGTGANPGMRWLTHWISTGTRANTVAAAENQLATSPNAADLSTAVNGYFEIPNVNFRDTQTDVVAGLFGDGRPAPRDDFETVFPGLPSTAPADPNYIAGVALAFIEFPAPGMYYMGVNRDDGFRLTVATTEGGRDLVTGPNVQEVGVFNGGGGTDANNVQPNGFMPVYVPQAGVWPFRLLYWAGTGDDNVEWFQTNEQMPIGLINDSLTPSTLRAFRTRTVQPPAECIPVERPNITATRTAGGLRLDFTGTLQEATTINGQFNDLNVTSPHTVPTTETMRFYRSKN